MNKFKSSFKGSASPAPPAQKPIQKQQSAQKQQSELELMASIKEELQQVELDLQLVSDDARSQFADILGRVQGKKDIVIQPELLSLLDHVTPLGFLKRYKCPKINITSPVSNKVLFRLWLLPFLNHVILSHPGPTPLSSESEALRSKRMSALSQLQNS